MFRLFRKISENRMVLCSGHAGNAVQQSVSQIHMRFHPKRKYRIGSDI